MGSNSTNSTTTVTTLRRKPAKSSGDYNCHDITQNTQSTARQTSQLAMLKQRPLLHSKMQTQHHHHHHDFQHATVTCFAPTLAPAFPMAMPMPFGFPCPWMAAPQHALIGSATPSCCSRHAAWVNMPQRVGRPPHDHHCAARRKVKHKEKKKTVENALDSDHTAKQSRLFV